MNTKLVLPLLLLGFPVLANAKSLPPILDYLPSCSPNVIDGIYIEKKISGDSTSKVIQQAFVDVQKKAKEKRVDAVIITNLIQTNKLIITADLIDYCDEDESMSSVRTAYNALSRRPLSFERTKAKASEPTQVAKAKPAPTAITIPQSNPEPVEALFAQTQAPKRTYTQKIGISDPNFKPALLNDLELAKLASKANSAGKPSTNVTLSGAYGININNSEEYVLNVLGPANAQFTTGPESKAWLYGRDLWIFFEQEKVKKITYKENALLTYTGKNFILYDEDYDNNWQIDDKATFREDVNQVRQKLNYLQPRSASEYYVSNQKHLLTLDFSEFASYNENEPELLLSGFTFYDRNYAHHDDEIIYSDLNLYLLDDLFVPLHKPQSLRFQDLVSNYVPNIINYSTDGSWEVLSPNIQVKHEDSKIKQVKISEAINYPAQTDDEFMSFLRQNNIPATKKEMRDRFSTHATFWLEKMSVTAKDYEIRAEFTTEDEDAMLISLEVDYL